MSERVELTILRNLFFNEDFTRKVTPLLNQITLQVEMKEYYLKK